VGEVGVVRFQLASPLHAPIRISTTYCGLPERASLSRLPMLAGYVFMLPTTYPA
jgi:hypothetical protein